ncbi:unnamed protein product [Enterobius vermicularis]|uniref:Uncharacterized protein n=1 Tax=Enterobius vermicularis TaxID=51028 RepID=A0A0N4V494_ENTVE|nr:unnamed protein product [Enterobius vermicularis]
MEAHDALSFNFFNALKAIRSDYLLRVIPDINLLDVWEGMLLDVVGNVSSIAGLRNVRGFSTSYICISHDFRRQRIRFRS